MKLIIKILLLLFLLGISMIMYINFYIVSSTKNQFIKDKKTDEKVDAILVLGAGIWGDSPSPMLEDRLLEGIRLYKEGYADKLIMSGDHGRIDYDEVNIMKSYAIKEGVPSEDIFMDHAGFSTYESIYRAKEIFEVKSMIIVTQKYHLYRALHIANSFKIKCLGSNSDPRKYAGQLYRDIREILARNKDFFTSIIKPKPTYLGETIPVSGNGNITNDKDEDGNTKTN